MPSVSIEFHPEAVAEAQAARMWYDARSQTASRSFVAELDRAIAEIGESPNRWPQYVEGTRRFLFRRFPFMVVYRVRPDRIQILAVAHARRKPAYWKQR